MRYGRVSPCIGVCSTTYGDLVCRGCNRFAHEVVQWNGYDDGQRDAIWGRLEELRDGSLAGVLSNERVGMLCAAAESVKIRDRAGLSDASLAYEVLRRLAMRRMPLPWGESEDEENDATKGPSSAREVLSVINREFHDRSLATYERSYRIPAE